MRSMNLLSWLRSGRLWRHSDCIDSSVDFFLSNLLSCATNFWYCIVLLCRIECHHMFSWCWLVALYASISQKDSHQLTSNPPDPWSGYGFALGIKCPTHTLTPSQPAALTHGFVIPVPIPNHHPSIHTHPIIHAMFLPFPPTFPPSLPSYLSPHLTKVSNID